MINSVVCTGRLTKDVELRYTPNGVPVGTFTLAVNRNFKNEKGEQEADFVQCVVWRKQAEVLAEHVKKGSLIGIEGRFQSRSYEDKDGKRVFVVEINVEDFSFLEKKDSKPEQPPEQYNRYRG